MAVIDQGPVRGPFFFARFPVGAVCAGRRVASLVLVLLLSTVAEAQHRYAIHFDNGDDGTLAIGSLEVDAFDAAGGFRVTLNDELFGDFFLSMRPFRCMTHRDRMLCHLPYPYENRRRIARDDLTDLEYDLLFIARSPTEYGIDPWNGRYFRLRWDGDDIVGEMYETDLDILASPPEAGDYRPLANAEMLPVQAGGSQWAPVLRIVPES
jgi:hypothetical protein